LGELVGKMMIKLINYWRTYGLKQTIKKILPVLFRKKNNEFSNNESENAIISEDEKSKFYQYPSEEYLSTRITKPLNMFLKLPHSGMRLNIVTDSLNKDSLLGGVATCLILAVEFCNKSSIPLRIITRTQTPDITSFYEICAMNRIKIRVDVSFAFDNIFSNVETSYFLPVSERDVFLATSWWSAYDIKQTFPGRKIFYLVQEVETFFYAHGTAHYLSSRIMDDPDIFYIFNSHYLYDYYKTINPISTEQGTYFEPAFSSSLFISPKFKQKEKWNLFFYYRPNNPRNLSLYGRDVLDYCITNEIIDTTKWNVIFCGSDGDAPEFSNGYKGENRGLMSWREYAKFLTDIDLALCLMYTPHPSYPPYDVACSGGVVVSNTCLNKTEFDYCKNVLLSDLDFDCMVQTIEKGLILAQDLVTRRQNYESSTIARNWSETLASTVEFMREHIESCVGQPLTDSEGK
jgi:hypothetical protein